MIGSPVTHREAVRHIARTEGFFHKCSYYRERVKEEFGFEIRSSSVSSAIGSLTERIAIRLRSCSKAKELLEVVNGNVEVAIRFLKQTATELELQKEDGT